MERLVRINLVVPESERDTFEDWARTGRKPRLSTTDALRELMRAAAAGKIDIDREHAHKFSRRVQASIQRAKAAKTPPLRRPR